MLSVLLLSQSAGASTTVAVLEATSSETSAELAAQLNDDTWFDFDATVVSVEDIDETSELSAYDVVVMGGSGYGAPDWTAASMDALDTWVRAGGGLVTVGWFHYTTDSSAYEATIDALLPITMAGSDYEHCTPDTDGAIHLSITAESHPITDGLTDFTTTSAYVETSTAVLTEGAASLVTASGTHCKLTTNHAAVAGAAGAGRVAYLGPLYSGGSSYNNADLRSGSADRLLEQAVQWASIGGDVDGDGFDYSLDCDDNNASVYPGAFDSWYDGIDSNCDGMDDYDQDLDGRASATYGGDDCDDTNPDIYPGAPDAWYDGVDSNCDGMDDFDQDLDGFDAADYGGDDCDDLDPDRSPAASEVWYDGIDSDCDGRSDFDQDRDGADASDQGGDDCDDTDASIGPDAADTPYDGIDQDCSGGSDNDADGDGFDSADHGGDDCDDTDAAIAPGARDIADDGIDQDCDGADRLGSKGCAAVSPGDSGMLALLAVLIGSGRRRQGGVGQGVARKSRSTGRRVRSWYSQT